MKDRFNREIEYLRLSVTDRCTLRCRYCMPEGEANFLPQHETLSNDELVRLCGVFASLGVRHIRLTGGEPLCRPELKELAAALGNVSGVESLSLTTNGQQLGNSAAALKKAGVSRVNVSVDTLSPARYTELTRGGLLAPVLDGLQKAKEAGLALKLNVVPIRGVNTDEIADFVRFGKENNIPVRFIELMPVGLGGFASGFSPQETRLKIEQAFGPLMPIAGPEGVGPARYEQTASGAVVGFIGALHGNFCPECNRIRLTAAGVLRPCLGYDKGLDLKALLRGGASNEELREAVRRGILEKPCGHDFTRFACRETMNQIGG